MQPDSKDLFLLSERVSQDPLENYFGKQRARGGRCDNPSMKECIQNSIAIRAQQGLELDHVRGNSRYKRRVTSDTEVIDDTPPPKRKRHDVICGDVNPVYVVLPILPLLNTV